MPVTGNIVTVHEKVRMNPGPVALKAGPETKLSSRIKVFAFKNGDLLLDKPGDSYKLHPSGDLIAIFSDGEFNLWSLKQQRFLMESAAVGSDGTT